MNTKSTGSKWLTGIFSLIAVLGLFSGCVTSKMPARQHAELWGEPLPSIAMLDTVAADKDAVYVYVSAPEGQMTAEEQIAIEGAAAQLTDEGAAIGIFELLADSDDYKDAQESIATPCVLAMWSMANSRLMVWLTRWWGRRVGAGRVVAGRVAAVNVV